MTTALPVIDISRFTAGGPEREAVLAELRSAAHDVGFFHVTGHGIDPAVTGAVLRESRAFFALPVEERLEIENVNSPHFRGYTRVGTEHTLGRPDQRDQLDFGPERAALDLGPDDPAYLRLIGPNQWPRHPEQLEPAVLQWIDGATRASRTVLRALAAAIGQADDHFDAWFDEEATASTKLVRYPGQEQDDQGVGAHKDYGFLALILQDDDEDDDQDDAGLQVLTDDGWVDAEPLPGALVFNIGEALEIVTRGYLRATVHRVVSPPPGRERISVPFFFAPRLDAVVTPVELPEALAAQARGVDTDPGNPLFAEYGRKALLGWLRSHPRVAERWHPDLSTVTQARQTV